VFRKPAATALMGLYFSSLASAHGDHHKMHHEPVAVAVESKSAFEEINIRYLKDVKPIFEKKCFDCHSSQTHFPFYQKIPGIKQWIQHDLDEAKEHLNMDPNFPFESDATPIDDLVAIDKEVAEGEMPLWTYRMMHSGSAITTDEKQIIHAWVQYGLDLSKKKSK
jgi:hypothetical protein